MNRQISIIEAPGYRESAGTAYIAIPKDVDRNLFVEHCFRTGTVALITDFGDFIDKIKIDKNSLKDVIFPVDSKSLGSQVVWANLPKHQKPVVVGIITKNNELINIREGEFCFEREMNGTRVEISGSAKDGNIFVNIDGKGEGGIIHLKARNQNKSAKIKAEVSGDIDLRAEGEINLVAASTLNIQIFDPSKNKRALIKYVMGTGYLIQDEFENKIVLSEDGVEIQTNKNISLYNDKGSVTISDSGIDIDAGNSNISIGGNFNVLYSLVPGVSSIADVSQIGVSKKVTVG